MWKKLAPLGPHLTTINPADHEIKTLMNLFLKCLKSESPMSNSWIDQSSEIFCPNFLNKNKGLDNKYSSHSKIHTAEELQHIKSFN